ncbi:hypothetical protein [Flectobacillus rivi]|uniref:Uncharacterized protein n=1 Tax=Flectobacillus rivi TaxID=2984209 RepID=A0ABT6Z878_9BACT|nr:hypothetical protein [Flectobacillus rivi]MDI9877102.1 hypothetical protein [Flectobacillus rivi]
MHLEDFIKFVDKTIDELILYAQMHAGKDYTDYELEFLWQIYGSKIVDGKENIVYEITDQVFISPDKIYPCVNLIIEQLTPEKRLRILGRRAGYEPREFGIGWSNRPGPFIYGLGKGMLTGLVDTNTLAFRKKLIDLGLLFDKQA